jgi:hypothetical protein
MEEIWENHPVYEKYAGSNYGRAKNNSRDNILKGTKKDDGYTILCMYGYGESKYIEITLHKFIWECFNGLIDDITHEITHIDDDTSSLEYDSLKNLRILTTQEYNRIYGNLQDNPLDSMGCQNYVNQNRKRQVVRIKIKDDVEVERVLFDSTSSAAASIGIIGKNKSNSISNCCHGKSSSAHGYVWKFVENTSLPNEYWCSLLDPRFARSMVSNFGRVSYLNVRTYGYDEDGYMMKQIKHKKYAVDSLVCLAFLGYPPDSIYTVDHIDKNTLNNTITNLRWASEKDAAMRGVAVHDKKYVKKLQEVVSDTNKVYKVWKTVIKTH